MLSSSFLLHDNDIENDMAVQDDIMGILELCHILKCEQHMQKAGGGSVQYHREDGKPVPLPNSADTMVYYVGPDVHHNQSTVTME